MTERSALLLALGIAMFLIGALARTYMNIKIEQTHLDGSGTRSTEVKYLRLVKSTGAPMWPLLVTVILLPLGIVISFASVVWNNIAR